MCASPRRPSRAWWPSCWARACSSGAERAAADDHEGEDGMRRSVVVLAVGMGLLAPAVLWLAASAQAPAAVPAWVSDPQVYAAAKKEGSVVHYCTLPQVYCEDLGKRFEKHTGIKADITRMSSGPQYSRLMQEHQAGLRVLDVFEIALVAAAVEMRTKEVGRAW